jgi:TRAP-type C4-dicarboxylate transport system permease small subunit
MKQLGKILIQIIDGLTKLTGWIAALCLVCAAIIVTEAVIVRKILGISTIWQIEASVFLLIFTVFAGAPFVQKNEHHLNVDLVVIHLSPRTREITLIVVSIISCILAAILAWYAWPMWWEAVVHVVGSRSWKGAFGIALGPSSVDTIFLSSSGNDPAVFSVYLVYPRKNSKSEKRQNQRRSRTI